MRAGIVRFVAMLLALAMAISAAGCRDAVEIEQVGFVIGMGIDEDDDGGVKVILEVAMPTPKPEDLAKEESFAITARGATLWDAILNGDAQSSLRVLLGHVRCLVISERFARAGITRLLDALVRDERFRYKAWVVVTADPIEDVMAASGVGGKMAAMYINDLMQTGAQIAGVPSSRFVDLITSLEQPGDDPLLAAIAIVKQPESGGEEEKGDRLMLRGSAAFRDGKMVGWLTENESAAALVIRNKISGWSFLHEIAGSGGGTAGLSLLTARTTVKLPPAALRDPDLLPGAAVELRVKGTVDMHELLSEKQILTQESVREFEADVSSRVERDIRMLIQSMQHRLDADLIGLGELFRRRMAYSEWTNVAGKWHEVFPTLNISVVADIGARKRGMTMRSPSGE